MRRRGAPSVRRQEEWLDLLDRSGPFITVPVARRIWPVGLPPLPSDDLDAFRLEEARRQDNPEAEQRHWISYALRDLLDWRDALVQGPDVPSGLELEMPEHRVTVRPDFAFREPGAPVRLLGLVLPVGSHPTGRGTDGWSASAADRLALLLRRHDTPLGLATDGRWWALVWVAPEGASSVVVWDAALWMEERETMAAFRALLERRRFLGVPDDQTLPALLAAGLGQEEEITESLGRQVRQAVEMLVEAVGRVSRRDTEVGRLVAALDPAEVYHGAVTVMMRLVFLLFAEERQLLPADDDLYLESYSAGRLVDQLEEHVRSTNEEALELRTSAWQRLLALFRGVHGGIAHDSVRIPAYGGEIFDPDRHPWLEGRPSAAADLAGRVLPIDDRTVLHALRAVQYVDVQGERRRLSFRTLDVEQIGYVYEGLLGFDALRASEPVVSLVGRAGEEREVGLSELEALGADADALAELCGLSAKRVATLMASLDAVAAESQLRAVTGGDEDLLARLKPYAGLIRADLRGLPVVVPAGGIFVTESPRRRLSGTHYTPRNLAEKVVIGALEPLVYTPGPLETGDRAEWRRRPSNELLTLKIADIAMGSGAFLVAACRYLAGEVIEAWAGEGDPRAGGRTERGPGSPPGGASGDDDDGHAADQLAPDGGNAFEGRSADPESDPVVVLARRTVIEHCLYGGDINPMAVEMAKLSLWLISLSRERPFSFLDDRMVCGDSLLGLNSMDQLRTLHLDPAEARRRLGEGGLDIWGQVRERLEDVERLRAQIAGQELVDVRDAQVKARLLDQANETARPLKVFADALVGAAIAAAGRRRDPAEGFERVAQAAHELLRSEDTEEREARLEELQASAEFELDTDRPAGAFDRRPTHWPLVFPEVFEAGGFDAVVGNPPFLGGQKLTGAFGTAYREYLVRWVAGDARGSADLLAYFLLVAGRLLSGRGQTGLIGTNTMAQGDTRQVGLDQLLAGGTSIRAAVKSAKWPTSTVNLEYAVVWSTPWQLGEEVPRYLADEPVRLITSSLDAPDEDLGQPHKLAANSGIAFIGSYVLGMGFTMPPEQARELIRRDPRNREVLFPYINGEDLNSRPDSSASRWVINFFDWPLERAEEYADCLEIVRRLVKPERDRNNRVNYREYWWRYAEHRPGLVAAIAGMDRVLAITLVSKVVLPVRIPTGQIFAHRLAVFAAMSGADLGLLSSVFHRDWGIRHSSTMRTDPNYSPSDCFDTFARPEMTARLDAAGEALDAYRRPLMLERSLGLTALYNQVSDRAVSDPGVQALREIHVEIDYATADAYAWDDIDLGHGIHDTAHGLRFTISAGARREVLRRLLKLNHQRHAEEAAAGLTDRRGKKRRSAGQMSLIP